MSPISISRNSLLVKFHSVGLATVLAIAHKTPKNRTSPIFIQAEGKIPISAHEYRVNGLASWEGFVSEMSSMFSESKNRNKGVKEVSFRGCASNLLLSSSNECNFVIFTSSQTIDRSIKVRKNFKSPVGQIDAVAIFRNFILIVECKKPIFKSDVRELLQDLVEAQEWEKKLERKVEWAKINKSTLFEQIMGKEAEDSFLSVDGVIVTYRPFYPLDWKFDILFRYEFIDWLEKLNWTHASKV